MLNFIIHKHTRCLIAHKFTFITLTFCLLVQVTKTADSPIHEATQRGDSARVSFLLSKETTSIDQINQQGLTPLSIAARDGHTIIVQLLLQKKANIHLTPVGGWTALHRAIQNGHTAVTKLLLDYGANINQPTDGLGLTPLYLAANEGNYTITQLLLSHNARVDKKAALKIIQNLPVLLPTAIAFDLRYKTNIFKLLLPDEQWQKLQPLIKYQQEKHRLIFTLREHQNRKRGIQLKIPPVELSSVWAQRRGLKPAESSTPILTQKD